MRRVSVLAAVGVALAAAANAAPPTHSFDLTYRGFGPVEATSAFVEAGPLAVRFEGCWAKDGPEAVCGFTLRAHARTEVTNLANLSHGTREDGSPARTCCLFRQGSPEGYPITATAAAPAGVGVITAAVEPGREFGVMLRLPDPGRGAPVHSVTFSRGGGDPGVTFPTRIQTLPAR